MSRKKIIISNAIICSLLCILGLIVSTVNVKQTYLTVSAPLTNGSRNQQQIGLMFIIDDAQLANNLTSILETLDKAQASATFFFTGSAAINNLALVQSIAKKHELGNYGFSNTPLNIADKNSIAEEIQLSDALIKSLTGTQMKSFTPPLQVFNKHTLAMADNLNYTTIIPTERNATIDWQTADSNLVLSYATYNIQNGDIIALKPTVATMQCFSQIVSNYLTNELQIISLAHLFQL